MQSKSTDSGATAAPTSAGVSTLTELCNDAAQHVAQARLALFTETADTDGALDHLDQAISCLKRVAAQGRALGFNGAKEQLRSA
jgi:hypothetical protein